MILRAREYQTTMSERTKYYLWLSATQNGVPFMVNHIWVHKKWLMLMVSACAFLQRESSSSSNGIAGMVNLIVLALAVTRRCR